MAYTFRVGKDLWVYPHIPKTSGRRIQEILKLSFNDGENLTNDQHAHNLPKNWEAYDYAFTVVREPAEWLRSLWGHRNRNQWALDRGDTLYTVLSHMVQPYASDDFDEFAWNVTANIPGVVGWFFGIYTPPPVQVVQMENVDRFLRELGADPDAVGVVGAGEDLPEITQETRDLVVMAEVATYIRYKYKANKHE